MRFLNFENSLKFSANTSRASGELKRIETMLAFTRDAEENPLHEVPSVTTALNLLKEHHEENCGKLNDQIQDMKRETTSRKSEIERLKSAIHELTAPSQ